MTRRNGSRWEWIHTTARGLVILWVSLTEALAWLVRRDERADRVHRAVVRLGPTFIKLGQIASTRPDLVPRDISERLEELQERVPPFPHADAKTLLAEELGAPVDKAFGNFPNEPVASASLSQVYFAELNDGTAVAVKVQRPGIRRTIERDLAVLGWLAYLAGWFGASLRNLRLDRAVEQFGDWTLRELDFAREAENLDEFRANFADWHDVTVPTVYWDRTTAKVLTMERVSGLRLHEVSKKVGATFARRLADRMADIELKMFISDAFFHADLHPGNVFFQPDGQIVLLDVGMVGRLSPDQRDRFLCYWIAITRRQRDRAFHHLIRMAQQVDDDQLSAFRAKYGRLLDQFYDTPLAERSLAQTYLDIVVAAASFGVVFPPEMVLEAKALVTAEALTLVLDPAFVFTDKARPVVARQMAQRATPDRLRDRAWGHVAEWVLLGEAVPAGEAPTADDPEEAAFRREARSALAGATADWADRKLADLRDRIPESTSAEWWREHPDWHALVETLSGLLKLTGRGLARLEAQSTERSDEPSPGLPENNSEEADGQARWRAFRDEITADEDGLGRDLRQIGARWHEEATQYRDDAYWSDPHELRASLTSSIGMLRLLVARLAAITAASEHETDSTVPRTRAPDGG